MATPTAPIVAQITLPPGFTLKQYYDLQGDTVNFAIAAAVASGVIIWDFLSMIPAERDLFRQKDNKLWKTPAVYAFMTLRYMGLLAQIPAIFITSVQNNHCQATASLVQTGVILVVASAGIIFSARVFGIWNYNKFVMVIVGILYSFMVGSWIAVGTQLHATQGPPTPFGSNCIIHPVPSWDPIAFSSSVAFDAAVLFLTLIKLKPESMNGSAVGKQILRDNILYFVILTITNVVVLVINTLPGFALATKVKPATLPYPSLMTTAMGTRVYLNLRLYNKRKYETETHPYSSGSSEGEMTLQGKKGNNNSSMPLQPLKGVMVTSYFESDASRKYGGTLTRDLED